jgi:hypothetical protein
MVTRVEAKHQSAGARLERQQEPTLTPGGIVRFPHQSLRVMLRASNGMKLRCSGKRQRTPFFHRPPNCIPYSRLGSTLQQLTNASTSKTLKLAFATASRNSALTIGLMSTIPISQTTDNPLTRLSRCTQHQPLSSLVQMTFRHYYS